MLKLATNQTIIHQLAELVHSFGFYQISTNEAYLKSTHKLCQLVVQFTTSADHGSEC